MNTKKSNILSRILFFAICSFALDSSIKIVTGGIRIHPGIVVLLLASLLCMLSKPSKFIGSINNDPFVKIAIIFIIAYGFIAKDFNNFIFLSSYLMITITIYLLFAVSIKNLNLKQLSSASIILLLFTGVSQYVISNFLGYPLVFGGLEAQYYLENPGFETRMRGFFLEPNWYGLVLLLWSCVTLSVVNFQKKYSSLILICMLLTAQYLTGNRLTLILQAHLALSYYTQNTSIRIYRLLFNPLLLVGLAVIMFFSAIALFGLSNIESDRSAIARISTLSNVINFFSSRSYTGIFFGYGFSNWGAYSNEYLLSFSNYLGSQALSRRDNSEIYVILFEAGIFGLLLFWMDLKKNYQIEGKKLDSSIRFYSLATAYFYICSLFYPTFTFAMYCIPLLLLRAKLYSPLKRNHKVLNKSGADGTSNLIIQTSKQTGALNYEKS